MTLKSLLKNRILVIDGATGTELAALKLSPADFGGPQFDGCNENLNLTRPDAVAAVHESYLAAGADIIETNTFGATSVVLAEYGLAGKTAEINIAAAKLAKKCAKKFSTPDKPRFVAGSMGPTTKAVFVTGGITMADMQAAYRVQADALLKGGVDILLLETQQDMLNVRAGLAAICEAVEAAKKKTPVILSVTIGLDGKMLSGQDVEAMYLAVQHYPLAALGFNCAAGPDEMRARVRRLAEISNFPVFCMPNAGLPLEDGTFPEKPEGFAKKVSSFATELRVNIAGGCCGTTPAHIKALAESIADIKPEKAVKGAHGFSGVNGVLWSEIEAPLLAGERSNSIGSKIFRTMIAEGKWDEAVSVAIRQAKAGAHVLDICLSNPERDELEDAKQYLGRIIKAVRNPIMIDTTNPAVAELAAATCPGKSIWNSVNLEHGPAKLEKAAELNKKYGMAIVAGCIDDDQDEGMAISAERKLEVAGAMVRLLSAYGVPQEDILLDALVFPVASGQEKYAQAAAETVKGIALFKKHYPKCRTILGVSNVSFGLPPAAREALNAVFLHQCVKAGLDAAIVNTEKLRRYASLTEQEKTLASTLLKNASQEAVTAFAALYRDKKPAAPAVKSADPETILKAAVTEGDRAPVAQAVADLLKTKTPMEIINGPLSQGMAEVGVLFGKGDLIVTEVLQSAEVMKCAVTALEPELKKSNTAARGKLLLATVAGDVHDIGKNLVHIIFESNGFDVLDLGVKTPTETIIKNARSFKPDVIGLSGLLTRSAEAMIAIAHDLKAAGINAPLEVGGAALSAKFVETKIAPRYDGKVIYCPDAMAGLSAALELLRTKTA